MMTGYPFKSDSYSDELCDPRLLRGDNISQGSLRWDRAKHWPQIATKDVGAYWLQEGDVVLAMDRPWIEAGLKFAEINKDDLPALLVQRVARLRGSEKLKTRFLKYIIGSHAFTDHVLGVQTGTAVPHISGEQIKSFKFALPPLREQRAIAHILGTLDDKIELNRRMNETLESMARALFKSWFVDFDPVVENALRAGNPIPGKFAERAEEFKHSIKTGRTSLPGEAAAKAAFPDSFEDSELGEIPKGWKIGRLDDVLVLQRGFDLPTPRRIPGPFPVIAASGPNGTHKEYMVQGPGVTTGRSGVLGNVFYVHADFWPLNTSLWVKEFKRSKPAYAFHLLRNLNFEIFNAGSAVPSLNRNHVHNLPTLLAPAELINYFENIATSILQRQRSNDDQARTLAALRDTLLPKLISGELRVKDVER